VVFLADTPLISFDTPGTSVRVIAVLAAIWFAVFAVPVLRMRFPFPAPPGDAEAAAVSWLGSYKLLVRRLVALYRDDPHLLGFLVSSAIFRDGLTAVFTFGGILASGTFGLTPGDVIIFAIVANVVSAAGALGGGWLDDRVGPKRVIIVSLAALVVVAAALLFASGPTAFWVGGLFLSLFVGPAQACSRSYLARLVPPGREGELFGLYATTGRAVSFLAPALFAVFVAVTGDQQWGIAGIGLVLLLGLITLIPVRAVAGSASAGEAAVPV
jgi:UMF1 family MFS transporter